MTTLDAVKNIRFYYLTMNTFRTTRSFFTVSLLTLLVLTVAWFPIDALAGPGGEIVEFAFKTKIGRIISILLAIILLPLILMYCLGMYRGVKKAKEDLAKLAEVYPWFAWEIIQSRTRQAAEAIYGEWSSGKLEKSATFLTPEYLQAQNDILEMWKDEGRQNITEVKKIGSLKPLQVLAQDWTRPATVFVKVAIELKDYMIDCDSGKVIEGNKKWDAIDQVFVMVHDENQWLLQAIENDDNTLDLATAENEVITARTQPDFSFTGSKATVPQPAQDTPPAEVEQPGVEIKSDNDNQG